MPLILMFNSNLVSDEGRKTTKPALFRFIPGFNATETMCALVPIVSRTLLNNGTVFSKCSRAESMGLALFLSPIFCDILGIFVPNKEFIVQSQLISMPIKKILILGAAGRDFHNFLAYYKKRIDCRVVGFTATQIPGIANRKFPAKLAGKKYPSGIPIFAEQHLEKLIQKLKVDECSFAYSDVSHEYVMHLASRCQAAGASFVLLGPNDTMLKSKKPVLSVCAVRTGSGKSQVSRKLAEYFNSKGIRMVAIRHPMPYGNLERQAVERFAKYSDFKKFRCTIEEREEYERYVELGIVVYAGVDYEKILWRAEKEADVILWDGGNNDFSFYHSDFKIVIADPHRAGHELAYYPGETNFRMADVIVINKCDSASKKNIELIEQHAKMANPKAKIIRAKSDLFVKREELLRNKRVLVVEDGPTTTHGGMGFGAGYLMAKRLGCKIMNPKVRAVGSIKKIFQKFSHLKFVLPAMGYSKQQIRELEQTINRTPCDAVVSGTPINLGRLLKVKKPLFDVHYEMDNQSAKKLEALLKKWNFKKGKK